MDLDSITIRVWNTLHSVVIKDGTSQTQFTTTMAQPVFAPGIGNWVCEIRVGGNAGDQCAWKACCLSTRISMDGVAGMLGKVLRSDSPRGGCRRFDEIDSDTDLTPAARWWWLSLGLWLIHYSPTRPWA